MLNLQIDVLSVDTSDFYSNEELRLHSLNHRLRSERNRLVNGWSGVSKGGVRKTIRGISDVEAELSELGVEQHSVKEASKDGFDFSVFGDDSERIRMLVEERSTLKSLVSMKNRLAGDAKGKLLELLSNKVKANAESGGRHHIRRLRESAVSNSNVISVFDSYFTRTIGAKPGEFCSDFMIVKVFYFSVLEDLIFNGFEYDGEKYVYFTSSAGQIRTKKCVFVKESVWKEHEKEIMCGLTIESINEHGGNNPNKHLAYLALANSATDVWEEFDIDKSIVVDDFETEVFGTYDFVDDSDYSITRESGHKPITHTDGAGMILPNAFGVEQRNKMVRLPWVKGLLGVFPFDRFIEVNGCSPVIKDIYGKEHDVIEEGIQVVFTKSQFKLAKHYDSWDDYKRKYKENGCTAGFTNVEEERIKDATINYQMLQSLTDITDDEICSIAKTSLDKINGICSSIDSVKNVFGITPYNTNKTAFQKSIELYPELLNDEYAKSHLRRIKDSMVKRFKAGKLDVKGKYTFIMPDFYAACEHWFCGIENPKGLLDDGEVFCWLFRKDEELDCLRSPHLYLEHAIRNNVACSSYGARRESAREWFCTDALYTSCKDMISRILQFDVDGDKSLVVSDKSVIEVAKRNIEKFDIVPLYYDMKKAHAVHLDNESIYNGLNAAFVGGNIGIYSNNISKIWNSDVFVSGTDEEKLEAVNLIKILCMENNYVIDYAKTLYKPVRPDEINGKINSFTNELLPHFFKYAKDKNDGQVVNANDSFVNKLGKIAANPRLNFKKLGIGKIDCEILMCNPFIYFDVAFTDSGRIIPEETDPVIVEYMKFDKKYYLALDNSLCSDVNDKSDAYMNAMMKRRMITDEIKSSLSSLGYEEDDIVDILVKYLYGIKKSSNKTALWLCYGDVILRNIERNFGKKTKDVQCVDCGEWFEVSINDGKTCRCHECSVEHKREIERDKKRRQREMKRKSYDVPQS